MNPAATPPPGRDRPTLLRVGALPRKAGRDFDVSPDADMIAHLIGELGLLDLQAPRLAGRIVPAEAEGWDLRARLTARVAQPCVVTLEPVATDIDAEVSRRYRPHLPDEEAQGEVEMPLDETLEKLGNVIDLDALLAEELALALPLYPRAQRAELGTALFTEPGRTAMTDEEARPFAGLTDLRRKMSDDGA